MPGMQPGSIDLVIADPPYATSTRMYRRKKYGNDSDKMEQREVKEFTRDWLALVTRLLAPTGSIYVMCSSRSIWHMEAALQRLRLEHRGTIVWHYSQGKGVTHGYSIRHDSILWFSKTKEYTFNLDAIRVPQKAYRRANNMRGANPGDVWSFPQVRFNSSSRQAHPTQKPEGLIERIVLASSNTGDTVLDPFAGSGTSLRVCQQLDRRCIGIELNREFVSQISQRLDEPFAGFDTFDSRVLNPPIEMTDPVIRAQYRKDHERWFLSGRSQEQLREFRRRWLENYPVDDERTDQPSLF